MEENKVICETKSDLSLFFKKKSLQKSSLIDVRMLHGCVSPVNRMK